MKEFNKVLSEGVNQKEKSPEGEISEKDLLNFKVDAGITENGIRKNINVGILYIGYWLNGTGAAALYNLMEDAATAEISRAQVWQWLHNKIKLEDGRDFTRDLYQELLKEETEKIKDLIGKDNYDKMEFNRAVSIFDELVTSNDFTEFLTIPAYKIL
jgi:malate synthase